MTYHDNRRDKNEREIINALVAAGAYVIQMPRTVGFDNLVAFQGFLYIMEVKRPGKFGILTDEERERRFELITFGEVPYYIVTTPEEALKMIGR